MAPNQEILILPLGVVSKVDVGRLVREGEALNDFLNQAAIRTPGTPMQLPKTSKLLDETINANKLNVLQEADRARLIAFIHEVKAKAPIIHISFSADPSPLFLQRLMTWLRAEIHPLVLLQVGLQPNMGAGCVLRTTNQYFDFSLRNRFAERSDVLAAKIRSATA